MELLIGYKDNSHYSKDDSWRDAIAEMTLESMETRKRWSVELPPLPSEEDLIRGKTVTRPDKQEAIDKYQTRMK